MELTGNRWGGAFDVRADLMERLEILDAIGEVGIRGVDDDELRHSSELPGQVLGHVRESTEWPRRTLEVVQATLLAASVADRSDPATRARRTAAALRIGMALERYPRR